MGNDERPVIQVEDYRVTDDGYGKPKKERAIRWRNLLWFALFFAAGTLLLMWRNGHL